ncbi:MAG TPA: class I SAM-dependent methyltransferase [Ilumatobacteraceae bacterium]
MQDRTAHMLAGIDLSSGRGLEIGALASPVVTKQMGQISYVDHADTATLRADFAGRAEVDIEQIVDVDYVLGQATVSDAVGGDGLFDYVIASHVIEHVPDLIGWLIDLRRVLRAGGVISLAIPDKQQCFDILRPPTTAADLVDAHLRRERRPTPRQIFEHYSSAVSWDGKISWTRHPVLADLTPMHSDESALERAKAATADGDYADVHCWVFTPESFAGVMVSLQRLGLLPYVVERRTDTMWAEFFVLLRAQDPDPTVLEGLPAADALASGSGSSLAVLAEERARAAHLETERDAARAALAETLASQSWRVTRPLRVVNERARRLVSRVRRH